MGSMLLCIRQSLDMATWNRLDQDLPKGLGDHVPREVAATILRRLLQGLSEATEKVLTFGKAVGFDAAAQANFGNRNVLVMLGIRRGNSGMEFALIIDERRALLLGSKSDGNFEHTPAIRAVIGANFSNLFQVEPNWISRERFEESFSQMPNPA